MVESHRAELGDHTQAAEVGGVSYNTARKAFERGLGADMPPIRTLMAQEMVRARAQLSEYRDQASSERDQVTAARKDMIDSRAAQARAVRMARNNAIATMGISANLLRAGVRLSERTQELLADKNWAPKPAEAVGLLRAIASLSREAVETARAAEDMEARILGAPDLLVGVVNMTPEQAVITLQDGQRTLDRIRRRAIRGDLPPGVPSALVDVELVNSD